MPKYPHIPSAQKPRAAAGTDEITPKKKRNHGYSSSNKKRHSKKAEATLKTAAATPDEDVLTLTGAQLKTLIN